MIQKNKRIAIVILNYNGIKLLKKFLGSVINFSDKKISSIYLVDNFSSDKSVEYVNNKYPSVTIIKNKINLGYSKGYNEALKSIKSDYYILLNSDVEVTKNWLNPLFDLMESDINIAACQPKILSYKKKDYFEYAGASGGFIDKLGYPFCRGRIFETTERDYGQYDDRIEIFWASGCCLMIRSDIYQKLGGFDNYFFAHMEEIDLCWRINNLNLKVYCEPKSKIYHLGSQTLKESDPKKTYLNFRNNLIMILKNDLFINLLWKLPLRFILDFFAFIKLLMKKNSRYHGISVLKAYKDFILNFKLNFSKRNKNKGEPSIMYKNIIPMKYYLQKIKKYTDL